MSEIVKKLDALLTEYDHILFAEEADTIREAIAALQPGGEPVCWIGRSTFDGLNSAQTPGFKGFHTLVTVWDDPKNPRVPLYAAPAPVAVTDEMVEAALDEAGSQWGQHNTPENRRKLMRAALEAALSGQEVK